MNFFAWLMKIALVVISSISSLFLQPSSLLAPPQTASSTQKSGQPISVSPETSLSIVSTTTSNTLLRRQVDAPRKTSSPHTPEPLLAIDSQPTGATSTPLNALEIIMITNEERARDGESPLTWNVKLANSAMIKAKDLIAKQYFAHVSPTGVTVSDLANAQGYAYSLVGENIALGDFKSSHDVMNGWMNSPGHRANILRKGYTEIGVAAIMGAYEGRDVWYAVQEFGRPSPNCPTPDANKENAIKSTESQLTQLSSDIANLKQKIDSGSGSSNQQNVLIDEYNKLAAEYNAIVESLKVMIATYNDGVTVYNSCLAKEEAIIGTTTTSTE